ncbi:MAG: amidohydrolase family protein [Sphaerochaetaceae bacterium]
MNYLIRNVRLEDKENVDILVIGSHIIDIGQKLEYSLPAMKIVDAHGARVIAGLIDQHVHSIGGGGEDGPASRVPPIVFSDCAKAGVTTLVGTLGTDSHTRSLRDLLAMTQALDETGINAYCLTGSYEYPSPTLTGDVADDLLFCKPVIGCKLAISDHRCSCPTTEEIIRLASKVRLGGLISHKVGELHIHVGADSRGIEQLFDIIERTILPVTIFRPTHMGSHLEQAERFVRKGGFVDITAGRNAPEAIATLLSRLPPALWPQVTVSSDSNGSLPKWNDKREIIGMDRGRMTSLLQTLSILVEEKGLPLSEVLPLFTSNVAKALHFTQVGSVEIGKQADLVLLDGEFQVQSVMAKGVWLSFDSQILVKGMFED